MSARARLSVGKKSRSSPLSISQRVTCFDHRPQKLLTLQRGFDGIDLRGGEAVRWRLRHARATMLGTSAGNGVCGAGDRRRFAPAAFAGDAAAQEPALKFDAAAGAMRAAVPGPDEEADADGERSVRTLPPDGASALRLRCGDDTSEAECCAGDAEDGARFCREAFGDEPASPRRSARTSSSGARRCALTNFSRPSSRCRRGSGLRRRSSSVASRILKKRVRSSSLKCAACSRETRALVYRRGDEIGIGAANARDEQIAEMANRFAAEVLQVLPVGDQPMDEPERALGGLRRQWRRRDRRARFRRRRRGVRALFCR